MLVLPVIQASAWALEVGLAMRLIPDHRPSGPYAHESQESLLDSSGLVNWHELHRPQESWAGEERVATQCLCLLIVSHHRFVSSGRDGQNVFFYFDPWMLRYEDTLCFRFVSLYAHHVLYAAV